MLLHDFFLIQLLLACIGKFLEGSRVEEMLVQTKSFWPDTVRALMYGGHCNRSERGLNILTFVSNCTGHQIKNVPWVSDPCFTKMCCECFDATFLW